MKTERLYITGMGAVTPAGIGVDGLWKGLMEGNCGIREIESFDASELHVKRAGQVKDFNPKEYLPIKLVKDLEPYMQYAYVAAEEALKESGLDAASNRVGIVMASALSGINIIGETNANLAVSGKSPSPKYLTKAMGNIAAAQFSIAHGIKGPSMTVSTACSSGGDAITLASYFIKSGAADAVVVMAGEAATHPALIESLVMAGALSKTGDSRPFDADRNGFVLGEGGSALILESASHAKARGAKVIAELLGCANNTDAYNPVSPEPHGLGAAECMRLALADAGLEPSDIGYINAHGTATKVGDIAETMAIDNVFGVKNVPVSSTKGITGHMMGAGGIAEVITCVKAVVEGVLPYNYGCDTVEPECDLDIVLEPRKVEIKAAMSNAFGFGGQNSSIIVGKVVE